MERIKVTTTELFYIKDAVTKYYWQCKDAKEDKVVLKNLLSSMAKIHKAYLTKTKYKTDVVLDIIPMKAAKDKILCQYCGAPNGSPDPDVLCKECRDCFGHSFYHEL